MPMKVTMGTPLTPENIIEGPDGRWYHDGTDVTDHPFAWSCALGHEWHATLAARTAQGDTGCPTCYVAAHPFDAADNVYEQADVAEFTVALRRVYDSVPAHLSRQDRVRLAQVAYTELLTHLSHLGTLIALTSLDEEAMTVLHDNFAVGTTDQ